jgi:DNA-binding transcriptional regulator YdaS (Cro superfamily)
LLTFARMKTADVIAYFGTATAAAQKLGISRAAVSQWGDLVPLASAVRLSVLTGGALALDLAHYERPRRKRKRKAAA